MTKRTRSTKAPDGPPIPPAPVPKTYLEEMAAGLWSDEEIRHALEVAPPLKATPAPSGVDHVVFDADEVHRVIKALCSLRHTKTRRWIGTAFVPTAWQVIWIIAPVFGWRYSWDHPDPELAGTRVARTAYVEIPRKNGKSTLVSALLLLLLCADGEAAPEVYTGATNREQAQIVLEGAKQMALASPKLRRRIGEKNIQARLVRYPRNGGLLRSLSKVAEAAHGLNVSGAAIDELHLHRRRGLFDAIDTGTGARAQPLIFILTTADEGDEHTVYAEQHGITERLADGVYTDHSHYGVIWAAHQDADPFADATIARANPGAGVTVTWTYLRKKRDKARHEPSFEPTYLRLHLCRRERSESRLIPMADWRAEPCVQLVDQDRFAGETSYAALDLASATDFTAFTALTGPDDDGMMDLVARFWLPEERVDAIERQCRVPIRQWIKAGWIATTEGNVTDYRKVRRDIKAMRTGQGFKIPRIGYDPWNATETVLELEADGFAMIPIRQGYATLSAPTKLVERTVLEHHVRHGGNPVLAWMASCLDIRRDDNGNIRPVKPDIDHSAKRIDGMVTTIMASSMWLRFGAKPKTERPKVRVRRTG